MAEVPSQYSDMNDSLNNDESIVLGWKKYDKFIKSHLDNYTFEDDKSKNIIALAKAMWDIKDFKNYIEYLISVNNSNLDNTIWEVEISEKFMDDLTQLAQIKNNLSELKWNIETQNEIPFDILWWTIEIYDLLKWKNKTKFVLWKRTIEREWNLYKVTLEYNNRPFTVLLEYSKWSNVILVHDKRYNEVIPVPIISTHVNKQHVNKLSHNNLDITSYETFRPIEIKTRRYQLDLILAFKK
jgi:hypothetical protein